MLAPIGLMTMAIVEETLLVDVLLAFLFLEWWRSPIGDILIAGYVYLRSAGFESSVVCELGFIFRIFCQVWTYSSTFPTCLIVSPSRYTLLE